MQDGSSRLLKAYSTDFESGCVAVVIDESNFDQPVVANQSISSDDVHRVIGPDLLQQLAAKSGLSVQELTQKLSQIMPQDMHHMTAVVTITKL